MFHFHSTAFINQVTTTAKAMLTKGKQRRSESINIRRGILKSSISTAKPKMSPISIKTNGVVPLTFQLAGMFVATDVAPKKSSIVESMMAKGKQRRSESINIRRGILKSSISTAKPNMSPISIKTNGVVPLIFELAGMFIATDAVSKKASIVKSMMAKGKQKPIRKHQHSSRIQP